MKKLSNEELLAELEVPFPVDQVLWRVTNTANNRTRGQVVPYADPRAYTDRLNALVRPQGWTRTYETVTMNNITRTKRSAEIVTGKILVTCKVTIDGLGTHSGTGEEWADEDNAMTSAEAQAFKRSSQAVTLTAGASNSTVTSTARNGNSAPSSATGNKSRQNGSNGSPKTGVKPEGTAAEPQSGSELDKRIARYHG